MKTRRTLNRCRTCMAESTGPTPLGSYPQTRLRRLRRHDWSRRLVREASLSIDDLIWPLFIHDGAGQREPIASLPGVDRLTVDLAVEAVGEAASLGIPAVALFPAVDAKLKSDAC